VEDKRPNPTAILARYVGGPAQLAAAITGLDDPQLDLAESSASWTIRQIVHHVADGDDLWKTPILAALGNDDGVFTLRWYWDRPQDEWATSWDYAGRPVESSLDLFSANRRRTAELLARTPDAWERSLWIQLPDGDKRRASVGYIVQMQADHLDGHIDDIRRIRELHGV
jgi:uncharacterized damage-inducible protein DinB